MKLTSGLSHIDIEIGEKIAYKQTRRWDAKLCSKTLL